MELPSLARAATNFRHCLLLKADDIYFTRGGPRGEASRNEFLGLQVQGLADENVSDEEIATIDVNAFEMWRNVRDLHGMLDQRRLSLHQAHCPDVDEARLDLEFVEFFLSTLPNVALGGLDLTSARVGEVRRIYDLAYAWLNVIDTIESAFSGAITSSLTVGDLALLSGLDVRTVRNRCGPGKQIRTSAKRAAQERNSASAAFVSLHSLDAIDWLKGRPDFKIAPVDPDWIARALSQADPEGASRGLLLLSVVNSASLAVLAPSLGVTPEVIRQWFDMGEPLPPAVHGALSEKLLTRVGDL